MALPPVVQVLCSIVKNNVRSKSESIQNGRLLLVYATPPSICARVNKRSVTVPSLIFQCAVLFHRDGFTLYLEIAVDVNPFTKRNCLGYADYMN